MEQERRLKAIGQPQTDTCDSGSPMPSVLASRNPARRLRHIAAVVAKRGLRAVERVLHPRRRQQARDRLAALSPCEAVVFLCSGNICRSPYAAAAFRRAWLSGDRNGVVVDSAGLFGPGRPSPDVAVRVASCRGVDLRDHRSRLLDPRKITNRTVVFVMDGVQRRAVNASPRPFRAGATVIFLGDLDPQPVRSRAIPDPYDRSEAFFEETFARIDRCVEKAVQAL